MFSLKALRSKLRTDIGVAEACVHHLREDANGIRARLSARPIAIFGNAVHNQIEAPAAEGLVGLRRPPARVRPERFDRWRTRGRGHPRGALFQGRSSR